MVYLFRVKHNNGTKMSNPKLNLKLSKLVTNLIFEADTEVLENMAQLNTGYTVHAQCSLFARYDDDNEIETTGSLEAKAIDGDTHIELTSHGYLPDGLDISDCEVFVVGISDIEI